MKKLFTILVMLMAVSASLFSQSVWIEQPAGYPLNSTIWDINFFNSQTGLICGWGSALARTTNGGTNWNKIPNGTNAYYSMSFINNNTGWVSGRFGTNIELLRKTTDAGLTWDSLYFGNTGPISYITFLDANTGYSTIQGMIHKTVNGGMNWSNIDNYILVYHTNKITFINSMTGWASKGFASQAYNYCVTVLLKTTNSGVNWFPQIVDTTSTYYINNSINDIQFLDANTGYIAMCQYGIRKTTDGGQTWAKIYEANSCNKLYFINSNTGWAESSSNILKTTNGGMSWLPVLVSQGVIISSMQFVNEFTGWAAGSSNSFPKLFKTTNGGVWVKNISTEIPSAYSLSQNYPNPFNPITNVKFSIVKAGDVRLSVFDVTGRKVEVLVNERMNAGTYEAAFDGSGLTSGVYFYRMQAEGFSETRRMILLK